MDRSVVLELFACPINHLKLAARKLQGFPCGEEHVARVLEAK
jgi:hypothetical protein